MGFAEDFDVRPGVRRKREAMRSSNEFKKPVSDEPAGEGGGDSERPPEPAHKVEQHNHHDGSYHSITHHADGKQERKEHGSHSEAVEHEKKMFHEDGGDEKNEQSLEEMLNDHDGDERGAGGGDGQ
jgi:hypothetical protein